MPPAINNSPRPTLYFAYGSNLSLTQMASRCPTSTFRGLARLPAWRWLINARGYANIIPLPDPPSQHVQGGTHAQGSKGFDNEVWGLVYSLQPEDERRLDVNEGVPWAYRKEWMEVGFWRAGGEGEDGEGGGGDRGGSGEAEWTKVLVYVDRERVEADVPKGEYVHRMNVGIRDALIKGVPKGYVEGVLRRFIPEEEEQ